MQAFLRSASFCAALLLMAPAVLSAQSGDVRLRPGDAVQLEVKDEPALAGKYVVGDDGAALLPLVGLVPVAGRPFGEVRDAIRAAYERELVDAVLRATPLVRVAVLGEVRQPGLFLVNPTEKLREVLALAGGLAPSADRGRISLVRDGQATRTSLDPQVGVTETALRSGDEVVVDRRSWIRENLGLFLGTASSLTVALITGLMLSRSGT